MRFFRKISLFMTGFLMVALLTSCGRADKPPQDGGPPESENAASADKVSPQITIDVAPISFWFAGGHTSLSVMRGIVNAFNQSQDAYAVSVTAFDDFPELYRETQAAIATGRAPDVVVLERDASMELYQKGLTVDLTQVLQQDANFNADRFLSVYYNQGVSDDGRIFAMPLYGTTQVMYYNKAAFDAAGVSPDSIRTWQDLASAAKQIQDTDLYEYGWEPMWGYENMVDAALSNGGAIYSEDGRTVTINSPEWAEVWEAYRKWLHEDRIMRIHSGGYGWEYWNYTRNDVMEGRAGGYTGSSGDQADVDFEVVGMLEQPAWDDGQEARPGARALLLNVLSMSEPERRDGAYALIRYLIDAPAQAAWTIGTGYVAVNQDVLENADYQAYLKRNPYAQVPLSQSAHASVYPYDPTGGLVREAIARAADRVQIENLPAQEVLDEAQRTAQKALDAALATLPPRGELEEAEP